MFELEYQNSRHGMKSMSAVIKTLPPEVVHIIAAGEVIDSIAAVARELVENALDAGATRISVSVWPEAWRFLVVDNGCGMDLDCLQVAATAHSTSKINNLDDLRQIASLGFRGEALHSLAQLSRLEIKSRTPGGEGWRVVYDAQGIPVEVKPAGMAVGTIVTVADLFGSWEARRMALPSLAQQMRSLQQTLEQIALCHPHVSWQVQKNDRRWFNINPGKTAQQILPQMARGVDITDLQHKKVAIDSQQHLKLVLGLPDRCHRRQPDWVKVAINGRMVRAPELEQAIITAFGRTLPRNRYPVCFAHLHISPEQIDWNRQPSKTEIYLQNMPWWQQLLGNSISQALRLTGEDSPANQQRVTQLIKTSEAKSNYTVTTGEKREVSPYEGSNLIQLRAVAQLHNTYIVAEHPGGVWLVEQHIAHERILYEELRHNWQLVPLEPPVILSNLTEAQLEQLERLRLDVSEFGNSLWAIRDCPAMLATREDCADALLELSNGGDLQAAQVATACRSAIRNGTPLTLPEMQSILDRWQRTQNPRTCPHGRPIYLPLEESDLARFFRRHWVIGKSHGISR